MRKILAHEMVTIDGYFAGLAGELDWFVWDDALRDVSVRLLKSIDLILFGRVTYEMMAAYWPTATNEDPAITRAMNTLPKIVFSHSLGRADWNNTRIMPSVVPGNIRWLKEQTGKDIVIYGSGKLVSSLAREGLIDEYRLVVNPVILGRGKSLFTGIEQKLDLKLLGADTLGSGNVLLRYEPAGPVR